MNNESYRIQFKILSSNDDTLHLPAGDFPVLRVVYAKLLDETEPEQAQALVMIKIHRRSGGQLVVHDRADIFWIDPANDNLTAPAFGSFWQSGFCDPIIIDDDGLDITVSDIPEGSRVELVARLGKPLTRLC